MNRRAFVSGLLASVARVSLPRGGDGVAVFMTAHPEPVYRWEEPIPIVLHDWALETQWIELASSTTELKLYARHSPEGRASWASTIQALYSRCAPQADAPEDDPAVSGCIEASVPEVGGDIADRLSDRAIVRIREPFVSRPGQPVDGAIPGA